MALRETIIHRVLWRPNLLSGGERELVLTAGLLAGGIAITAQNLPAILAAIAMWGVAITGLRMMAKADPLMSRVFLRYIRYQRFYAPRSTPWFKAAR